MSHRISGRATPTLAPGTVRPLRTRRARVEDGLLTVLATLGVVCIAATIAALTLNVSLIMFKTGSMSPTIPTGSLAVVREIPASDIRVGDVTTVARGENQLPVTHRVISTTPLGNGMHSIQMKGDANGSPDSQPYEVAEVKKVLWHVPRLAYVVAGVSQPRYMAGLSLAAALLVGWAFWPRRHTDRSGGATS